MDILEYEVPTGCYPIGTSEHIERLERPSCLPITVPSPEFQLTAAPSDEDRKAKQAARSKAYYEANKDVVLARQKAYQQANKEAVATYQKSWYAANKERRNAASKAYREANKEAESARQRAWYQDNKERAVASRKAYYEANKEALDTWKRGYSLKRKYGITSQQLEAMIEAQKNRCPSCKVQFGILKSNQPHVNHCHSTGRVCGVLCGQWNKALGLAGDNPKILRALARYLERISESSPQRIST